MANIKSAQKRARQNITRRAHNMSQRSRLRTAIKKVVVAIAAGYKELAITDYKAANPKIDSMAHKAIVNQ